VPVAEGGHLHPDLIAVPPAAGRLAVARGQRAAEIVAAAAPGTVAAGVRVDVLVTRERSEATVLALQDVEVLAVRPAPADEAPRGGGRPVAATLRVTLDQAVRLAAADAFAREVRLLARAPGDRRRSGALTAGGG
jgi:pilus assembly protein CpaB